MGKVEVIKIHPLLPLMEPQHQEVVEMEKVVVQRELVVQVEQDLVHLMVVEMVVMAVIVLLLVVVLIPIMQVVAVELEDILVMVVMVEHLIRVLK
tara:strand:+ start:19 stop:303 length:285 start_codon:yes stop_codon:yes gene_type:complete